MWVLQVTLPSLQTTQDSFNTMQLSPTAMYSSRTATLLTAEVGECGACRSVCWSFYGCYSGCISSEKVLHNTPSLVWLLQQEYGF